MSFIINRENIDDLCEITLFICAIGFEKRSSFLIEKLKNKNLVDNNNTICFYFLDHRNNVSNDNYKLLSRFCITPIDIDKNEHSEMLEIVKTRINELKEKFEKINIHVDYSSMPRNWYANLLLSSSKLTRENDNLFFWYSHGDYTNDIGHCSTAGADDFVIFSGKASIKPRKRSHILGLGYDKIKSDAIRTVVDPSTLVICYTYPLDNLKISHTIQAEHRMLFDSAAFSFSLPIENFNFIVNRIKEVVMDLREKGDVILIPDGPKPLILACSLIPTLIDRKGIICFHVKSHNENFIPENIKPTGMISGFSFKTT